MDVIAKQRAAIETLLRNQDNATVIPIRESFANDDRISLGVFAMIPDEIAEEIAHVQAALRAVAPHYHYAPRECLHLTVQNVRTVAQPPTFTEEEAQRVADMTKQVARKHGVQRVRAEGVIELPSSLMVTVFYTEAMHRLIAELSEGIERIGLPDDKRYVDASTRFGNITICRFTAPPTKEFIQKAADLRQKQVGEFEIKALSVASTNAVFDLEYTRFYGAFDLA